MEIYDFFYRKKKKRKSALTTNNTTICEKSTDEENFSSDSEKEKSDLKLNKKSYKKYLLNGDEKLVKTAEYTETFGKSTYFEILKQYFSDQISSYIHHKYVIYSQKTDTER